MIDQQCADVKISSNSLCLKKLNINTFINSSDKVTFIPDNINLSSFEKIQIIIKNIKTREEYFCPFIFDDNSITIDLSKISHLFTDYEGSIYIILVKENITYSLNPIIKKSTILKSDLNNKSNRLYQWFIRILENGEILFSSVKTTI